VTRCAFDPSFPATFPRFVQHALWAFCAQDGLDVCNGNQIDNSRTCKNINCPVFEACARVPLRPGHHLAAACDRMGLQPQRSRFHGA
jgi:hypothetical protein